MDTYSILWYLWLLAFALIEGPALLNKTKGDTLSEHVWSWFAISAKGPAWRARRFVLLAFLGWLAAHFLTGGQF